MPRPKKLSTPQEKPEEEKIQIVTQDILTNAKLDTLLRDLIEVKEDLKKLLEFAGEETDEEAEEMKKLKKRKIKWDLLYS